jgi:crotonobetainyl-CoA:carnitine CoA-transferase CaiB-like acyl-CoA transferase
MLADLGADVIKIEKFPAGDDARQYQKPGDSQLPPSFRMINRGKRSLAIDIRRPEGKETLLRMSRQADVLTENFRVGVMDRLGLGYEHIRKENSGLIYCSITGYGSVGPLAGKGGFDLILQAFSGLAMGTAHSLIAPYQVFHAADGGIVIGGGNPNAWRRICEVLGHPEWQDDVRFNHPQKRVQNRQILEILINAVLASGDVAEWCSRLDAAGVPCGPLNTAGQALDHPQTAAIGMVIDVEDGEGGMTKGLGSPVVLSGIPATHAISAAPHVGEQTESILLEFGFSPQEIADLDSQNVISLNKTTSP